MQDVLAMRGRFREIPGTEEKPNVFEDWWAIFDGHGGREAASYAAENLHQIIATNLDQLTNPSVDDRVEAIKKAFQSCNKQMAPWNPIVSLFVCF
jgi:serine/threonine protein phosphatase PrpC